MSDLLPRPRRALLFSQAILYSPSATGVPVFPTRRGDEIGEFPEKIRSEGSDEGILLMAFLRPSSKRPQVEELTRPSL